MLRATAETAAEDPRAFVINLWGELYSQQRLNKGLAQRLLGIDAVEEATSLSVPFDVGSLLGEGQSSKVYVATRRGGRTRVALKVMSLEMLCQSAEMLSMVRAEVQALHELPPHPHVTSLLGVLCTPAEISLELELLDGGDMLGPIERSGRAFTEQQAGRLVGQLSYGYSLHHIRRPPPLPTVPGEATLRAAEQRTGPSARAWLGASRRQARERLPLCARGGATHQAHRPRHRRTLPAWRADARGALRHAGLRRARSGGVGGPEQRPPLLRAAGRLHEP
jgi:hypothetical protein